QSQRTGQQKCPVLCKPCASRTNDITTHGRAGHEESRKIEHGIYPIRPSRYESVKIAEGFLGPNVQTTFFRKPGRKLIDDKCGRHEKENRDQNPEADRRGAVVRRGSYPART